MYTCTLFTTVSTSYGRVLLRSHAPPDPYRAWIILAEQASLGGHANALSSRKHHTPCSAPFCLVTISPNRTAKDKQNEQKTPVVERMTFRLATGPGYLYREGAVESRWRTWMACALAWMICGMVLSLVGLGIMKLL